MQEFDQEVLRGGLTALGAYCNTPLQLVFINGVDFWGMGLKKGQRSRIFIWIHFQWSNALEMKRGKGLINSALRGLKKQTPTKLRSLI